MNAAQEFVVVKAPLGRVYEQWLRIEDPPKFIPPLRGVRRIDDTDFSYVWHPRFERETEVILRSVSIFDPSNLSRRVETISGQLQTAGGKQRRAENEEGSDGGRAGSKLLANIGALYRKTECQKKPRTLPLRRNSERFAASNSRARSGVTQQPRKEENVCMRTLKK